MGRRAPRQPLDRGAFPAPCARLLPKDESSDLISMSEGEGEIHDIRPITVKMFR